MAHMRHMKHYLLAAGAATMLLSACQREIETGFTEDAGSVALEGHEALCNYDYHMEFLTGGVKKEILDRINGTIIRKYLLYDEEAQDVLVPAACERWAANIAEAYKVDAGSFAREFDTEENFLLNWEFSLDGRFTGGHKSRKLLSYCVQRDEFTGGAHGMHDSAYNVFDLRTGELITEDDLFAEGYREGISALMLSRLLEAFEEDDLFEYPKPNGNFIVDETGITWCFNPYEIAPYAMGSLEARLSWEELKPYLK